MARSLRLPLALLGLAVAVMAGAARPAAAQQPGRITGVVTDLDSKAPIPGANVLVAGTARGTQTDAEGRFTITNVLPGVVTVEVRRVGFGLGRVENVRVPENGTVTVNVELNSTPLRLESVVVSGTTDPTSGLKSPITVAKLTAADLPVAPATSAAGAIQGKVAGARINRVGGPGSGVNIQLRTPTSQFKSTNPMYVVDGVILGSTVSVTTLDIDANNIESIEVIKGAAAASLYGSRAANGVISITTKRGQNVPQGQTEITARTEYGFNQYARFPSKRSHHQFRVNDAGQYVDADGNVVPRTQRVLSQFGIADNPYPDPLYDHADQFIKAGSFSTVNLSVAQNTASTNWAATYNRYAEGGVVSGSEGFTRQNFSLNLDHRMGEKVQVTANVLHSRGETDPSAFAWDDLYQLDPDVNLLAPSGIEGVPYIIRPDSLSTIVNPLYLQYYNDDITTRARTMLSSRVSYRPIPWLNIDANFSYDRADVTQTDYTAKGLMGTDGETPTTGYLFRTSDQTNAINGDLGGTVINAFGDLTSRFTVRGLVERETNPYFSATGTDFSVSGAKDLDVATTRTIASNFTDRRAISYMGSWALDYAGKYIGDFVARRDGSSLFGPENRWNMFYRGSAAYRLSEESWWPFENVNEFKVRYALGQGGTRPDFTDQYENLSIAEGGGVTRQSLGNALLAPEKSTEQEFAIDAIVNNRVSLSLSYAYQKTTDNIINVPLPALTGFNVQARNVGAVSGNTIEATVQAQVIQRPGFQWEVNLVADRSRSRRLEFNRSCYRDGILNHCENSDLGDMWGYSFARDVSQLPAVHANSAGAFQVNDDGLLVAVGEGNSYQDGVAKALWGETITVDGVDYRWGMPILRQAENGQPLETKIGDMNPDLNFGFGNTVRWRGFQVYALFTGQLGGNIYNLAKRTRYASADDGDVDQAGKPEGLKKPAVYYSATYGVTSPSSWNDFFVEDATYLKLNEVQVRYSIPQTLLSRMANVGVSRVALELTGRNLYTWTGYSGSDPEDGSAFYRVESSNYPLYRTITGGLNVTF
jgi:TonB-linked SusC/RagA family outer membrane protein